MKKAAPIISALLALTVLLPACAPTAAPGERTRSEEQTGTTAVTQTGERTPGAPTDETALSASVKEETQTGASKTPTGTTVTPTVTSETPTATTAAPTGTTETPTGTTVTPPRRKTAAAEFAAACRDYALGTLKPLCTFSEYDELYGFIDLISGGRGRVGDLSAGPEAYYREYTVTLEENDKIDFCYSAVTDHGLSSRFVDMTLREGAGAPLPEEFDFPLLPEVTGLPYEADAMTLSADGNGGLRFTYTAPVKDGSVFTARFLFAGGEDERMTSLSFHACDEALPPEMSAADFIGCCRRFVEGTLRELVLAENAVDGFLAGFDGGYPGSMKKEESADAVRYFLEDGGEEPALVRVWDCIGENGLFGRKSLTFTVRPDALPPLPEELDLFAFPTVGGLPRSSDAGGVHCTLYTRDGDIYFEYNEQDQDAEKEFSAQMRWTLEGGKATGLRVSARQDDLPLPGADPLPYAAFVPEEKVIAFTFDDGPDYWTSGVLDVLEGDDKATFFITGYMIDRYPETRAAYVRRALDMGCEVGIHCYYHENNVYITSEKRDASSEIVEREIKKLDEKYRALFGKAPRLWRPMGGNFNPRRDYGYATVLWSVDSYDWRTFSDYLKKGLLDKNEQLVPEVADKAVDEIVDRVLRQIKPGDVVLMHDIYSTTVLAFEKIYKKLKAEGWRFVTVSELLGIDPARHHGQYFFSTAQWGENGKEYRAE